jgi:hypothetical protein
VCERQTCTNKHRRRLKIHMHMTLAMGGGRLQAGMALEERARASWCCVLQQKALTFHGKPS